jgi:hypothetical protein
MDYWEHVSFEKNYNRYIMSLYHGTMKVIRLIKIRKFSESIGFNGCFDKTKTYKYYLFIDRLMSDSFTLNIILKE